MNSSHTTGRDSEITLRRAALIAGMTLLVMTFTAPFAELCVYKRVVVPGDLYRTALNILEREGLFLAGLLCYLITFLGDLVVACAVYVLLAPVHREVSMLAAAFRLVHALIALFGLSKLVTAFRLLGTTGHAMAIGADQVPLRVDVLLREFRSEWSFSLLFFAIHLVLVGCLVYRSGYIPRTLGILLAIGGVGFLLYFLVPRLYPGADTRILALTFVGEPVFMLWLLVRGRKIRICGPRLPASSG